MAPTETHSVYGATVPVGESSTLASFNVLQVRQVQDHDSVSMQLELALCSYLCLASSRLRSCKESVSIHMHSLS